MVNLADLVKTMDQSAGIWVKDEDGTELYRGIVACLKYSSFNPIARVVRTRQHIRRYTKRRSVIPDSYFDELPAKEQFQYQYGELTEVTEFEIIIEK